MYVKTARAAFDAYLSTIAVDGNAIGDVTYMDAVRTQPTAHRAAPSAALRRAPSASLERIVRPWQGREWTIIAYAQQQQGFDYKVVTSKRNIKVERCARIAPPPARSHRYHRAPRASLSARAAPQAVG